MLLIDVAKIPEEGLTVHEDLLPREVHLQGEDGFTLLPGGSLDALVEKGDDDTVHVRGRLLASLGLACGRCLEDFALPVTQEIDLFYLPHRREQVEEEADEVELSDRDMVVTYYAQDRLDLGEVLREQLFLAIPMKRLCDESCRGLCPTCGTNRNTGTCECAPEASGDPRLLPLRTLLGPGSKSDPETD